MTTMTNPFHSGEIEAQKRAGVGDVATKIQGFIRDYLPEQHRAFHTSLPFLILSAADAEGRHWVTLVEGENGFVTSPNPTRLNVSASLDPQDPLSAEFQAGTDVGMLGIELASRRRNRLSGYFHKSDAGYAIDIRQTFGNCPQYISERSWHRVEKTAPGQATTSDHLRGDQISRITRADTMFIGTGQRDEKDNPANGFDASHRGGEAGFVQVVDQTHLRIPDYAGNNFFNTIGNILKNPKVGLLFVDFETGGLLQITGRATIDWSPKDPKDPAARRMIDVTINSVVDRPQAVSLRWESDGHSVRQLGVVRKVEESENITSFYLVPVDGTSLPPFKPGQHLPVELNMSEPNRKTRRSYSLSAAPNGQSYRLSIKRENQGLVSHFLHDVVQPGDVIEARAPAGDFMLPEGDVPVVLVSAGVGQTPVLSMLQYIVTQQSNRPTWYVHGARNGRAHAMKTEVSKLSAAGENVSSQVYYSKPEKDDRQGVDYDVEGRVSAEALLNLRAGGDAHYLLCGPAAFISQIQSGLEAAGVPAEQIHFETF